MNNRYNIRSELGEGPAPSSLVYFQESLRIINKESFLLEKNVGRASSRLSLEIAPEALPKYDLNLQFSYFS